MTQWSSTAGANTQTGTLTWNANGTLQKLVISDTSNSANGQTCTYGYDDLARLLSANCGAVAQTFGYDRFGNIWKYGSWTFNPGYDGGNRVHGFSYDGMGNVTNDGANSYSYDAEGRPISAAGVQTAFDAFGRAVELNNGGSYTQIVYSPSGLKFAYMNGSTLNRYLAPMVAGMAAVHVHGTPDTGYFQYADWLGSSRFASTGGGTVQYDRAYAPFGEVYAEQGGRTNRNFTGQTQDTTLGLYDFLFRQQSAAQGRWLVPDPAGLAAVDLTNPQTWNRYNYVANNPLSNIDPFGLFIKNNPPGNTLEELLDPSTWEFVCRYGTVALDGVDSTALFCGLSGPAFVSPGDRGGGGGDTSTPPPDPPERPTLDKGTLCSAVPFKITGIAPGQATGTTAISQTPRADIPDGGVAIKPGNFGVGGINGTNRSVFLGMTFTVNWSGTTIPSGIPTEGPFFPVDNIGPRSVRLSPGNAFDVYNYPSFKQAWASTRTTDVTTYIPANTVGVVCPK